MSTLREIKTRDLNLQEVEGCISTIRKIYTNAVLIVGCVLPRLDEENARGKELNKVKNLRNFLFLEFYKLIQFFTCRNLVTT